MQPVSYARHIISRSSLSIERVMDPQCIDHNFAVFGGNEDERIAVVIHGIRRSIRHYAIIVVHDSLRFENSLLQTFRPVTKLNIGQHSFDPLVGVNRTDAMQVRQTMNRVLQSRGIISIRVPAVDQGIQRMLASELLGLTYLALPFLLVLFGIRQTADGPFVNLAVGDRGGNYFTAIAGTSASRTVGQENMSDLLQTHDEVLFLPTEDLQEAQHISNRFGSYMRIQGQQTISRRGIWPFRHTERGITYQQTPTNTVNPQSLRNHTLVCGTAFNEPILVSNLIL